MKRLWITVILAALVLAGCVHDKPSNQAQDEAGSSPVAQNDSILTGLPPAKTPAPPRATLVTLPPTAPTAPVAPPLDTAPATSSASSEVNPLPSTMAPPPDSSPPPITPPSDTGGIASTTRSAAETTAPSTLPPDLTPPPSAVPPEPPLASPPADTSAHDTEMPRLAISTASPVLATMPPPAANEDVGREEQVVVLETSLGRIVIELNDAAAPDTCGNFRKLVSSGFYTRTVFHRVIPHFIIQGGDPNSLTDHRATYGLGGPGYTLPAEIKLKNDRGAVAMARLPDSVNPQRESNGSQFYICVAPCPSLDNSYTVFGHVIKGMEVAEKIAEQPRDNRDNPLSRIEMEASLQPKSKALTQDSASSNL